MAVENTVVIGDFAIETPIFSGFPLATYFKVKYGFDIPFGLPSRVGLQVNAVNHTSDR